MKHQRYPSVQEVEVCMKIWGLIDHTLKFLEAVYMYDKSVFLYANNRNEN